MGRVSWTSKGPQVRQYLRVRELHKNFIKMRPCFSEPFIERTGSTEEIKILQCVAERSTVKLICKDTLIHNPYMDCLFKFAHRKRICIYTARKTIFVNLCVCGNAIRIFSSFGWIYTECAVLSSLFLTVWCRNVTRAQFIPMCLFVCLLWVVAESTPDTKPAK